MERSEHKLCARIYPERVALNVRDLGSKAKRFLGGFIAFFFAFSMLSNCYCAPVPTGSGRSVQSHLNMPVHCEHHANAAKSKNSDCAPRYHNDHFDFQSAESRIIFSQTIVSAVHEEAFDVSAKVTDSFQSGRSPPVPPLLPAYYVLHHAFLI